MTTVTTPMDITAWHDPVKNETRINIVVTDQYFLNAKPAENNLSGLIDMPQLFGMLEDAVCMKMGLEPPRTNKRGHNV
jgi:hypothetical protein